MRIQLVSILACMTGISNTATLCAQVDDPSTVAARFRSQNNLKMIAKAFHDYHAETGILPRDITDKNGKPLLSWRVAILPYAEQTNLFKQFKLDEPWDSANNKPLSEADIQPYRDPRGKLNKGFTFYQSFSGPGALMSGKNLKLADITDGESNTFMVVEAGSAVPWSKPADVAFDPKKPLPKLGGIFDGEFNVVYCDRTLRYVSRGVKEEMLKKYITIAGAETLDKNDLNPAK